MPIEMTPWFLLWAAVTVGALALFVRRVLVAEQEPGALHVVESEKEGQKEIKIANRLARIDFWGKTLTVASAVLVLVMSWVSLHNTLLR